MSFTQAPLYRCLQLAGSPEKDVRETCLHVLFKANSQKDLTCVRPCRSLCVQKVSLRSRVPLKSCRLWLWAMVHQMHRCGCFCCYSSMRGDAEKLAAVQQKDGGFTLPSRVPATPPTGSFYPAVFPELHISISWEALKILMRVSALKILV